MKPENNIYVQSLHSHNPIPRHLEESPCSLHTKKSVTLQNSRTLGSFRFCPYWVKLWEKLVHQHLSHHLEDCSLLTEEQHGFRKAPSTVHAIAQLTNHINNKIDTRIPTLAVFIDFRKAFDCVAHPVLLDTVRMMNMDTTVIDWVRIYLSGRQQRVLANNSYSSYQTITQGVPQGSVLGPLFYIIYANDLSKIFKNCMFALYADDTVLYTSHKDINVSFRKLQKDALMLSLFGVHTLV